MSATVRVEVLSWPEALPLARPIREQVFVQEQGVPVELEYDELEEYSDHAIAFDAKGNAIGTARLLHTGKIGRMAVLKAYRGRGVGAALLRVLLQQARKREMASVSLHAQTQAVGFYRRFGFCEEGPEFDEAGIRHVEMKLDLDRGD